jgi:hypothetical protein
MTSSCGIWDFRRQIDGAKSTSRFGSRDGAASFAVQNLCATPIAVQLGDDDAHDRRTNVPRLMGVAVPPRVVLVVPES